MHVPAVLQDVCGYERDSMDTVVGYDARVIQCLQDYRCAHTCLHSCLKLSSALE